MLHLEHFTAYLSQCILDTVSNLRERVLNSNSLLKQKEQSICNNKLEPKLKERKKESTKNNTKKNPKQIYKKLHISSIHIFDTWKKITVDWNAKYIICQLLLLYLGCTNFQQFINEAEVCLWEVFCLYVIFN